MNLNKPSKELLVDLINQNHDTDYAYAAVTFENMLVMPYDAQRNTGITIKSTTGETPIAVPKNLYYDRVSLASLAAKVNEGNVPEIEDASFTTVHGMLDEINELLGTGMTADDLEDTAISDATYPRDVVVTAKDTSLVYTGQFTLVLNGTEPEA